VHFRHTPGDDTGVDEMLANAAALGTRPWPPISIIQDTTWSSFYYADFRFVVTEALPSAPSKNDATSRLIENHLEEIDRFE